MHIPIRHRIKSDETVLSWLARWNAIGGFYDESDMFEQLIGKKRVRIHPYLPSHIGLVADKTNFSAKSLLVNNTLFSLFRFLGCDSNERLASAMLSNKNGNPLAIAGIPHTKFSFYNGHKFCPECVRVDRIILGFGYFRIKHQIPGVEACDEHGCLLHALSAGDEGYDRKLLNPPKQILFEPASQIQTQFSAYSANVLSISKQVNKKIDYQNVYHAALHKKAFITNQGNLKIRHILLAISEYYNSLPFIGQLGFPASLSCFSFIGPLLRNKTHYPCHPAKHLLLGYWLFNGDTNAYLTCKYVRPVCPKQSNDDKFHLDQRTLELLKLGISMEKIAHTVNKSRCYVRRLAEYHNIDHASNGNSYPLSTKHRVVSLALLGRHRFDIATQLDVGVGYVEQVISGTAGLVEWRKMLRKYRKIQEAVEGLNIAKTRHPDWRRKELKEHCNQAFFYLYNHSRILLESILPRKNAPYRASVNWPKEDERLYQAISTLNNIDNLSIEAIGKEVADHGHLRRKLNELPRTKNLLVQAGKLTRNESSRKT
jgi:hypothetical protein